MREKLTRAGKQKNKENTTKVWEGDEKQRHNKHSLTDK